MTNARFRMTRFLLAARSRDVGLGDALRYALDRANNELIRSFQQ